RVSPAPRRLVDEDWAVVPADADRHGLMRCCGPGRAPVAWQAASGARMSTVDADQRERVSVRRHFAPGPVAMLSRRRSLAASWPRSSRIATARRQARRAAAWSPAY